MAGIVLNRYKYRQYPDKCLSCIDDLSKSVDAKSITLYFPLVLLLFFKLRSGTTHLLSRDFLSAVFGFLGKFWMDIGKKYFRKCIFAR